MKISTLWLQKYFAAPLPSVSDIADAFTFHSFEIDGVEGNVLDVKVLPNRAADCLSHRGIAKDLSAILNLPLKSDPLRDPLATFPETKLLSVEVDGTYVLRHSGALVRGVKVGPSPQWLKDALESVGQRSINNIVDATNYVMLDLGQPLHAFDAGKIARDGEVTRITIRESTPGEKITLLTGEEYELSKGVYVIGDKTSGVALDVAGIKGGMASGISEETTDLFVSVGNYDGTLVRKASQALKLFTDASQRYQNRPTPELTMFGMRAILALIQEVAGGEVVGVVDVYPKKPEERGIVTASVSRINEILGAHFSESEMLDVFRRLDFTVTVTDGVFSVTAPFERVDIALPEDLAEEVGRILGYDRVLPQELLSDATPDQARFRGIERVKDFLVERGFVEVSTQSFSAKGDVMLLNPLDKTKPALRTTLKENVQEALAKAKLYAPITLPPNVKPKVFEVGTVFSKDGERIVVETSEPVVDMPALSDDASYQPLHFQLMFYKPFSQYPFISRDVAVWVPDGTPADVVASTIRSNAGDLLVRFEQFDTFSKNGRTSYAFRMVFQSSERTLTDEEVSVWVLAVSDALTKEGWEVR